MKNDIIELNRFRTEFMEHIVSICPSAYNYDCSQEVANLDKALMVIMSCSTNKRITFDKLGNIQKASLDLIRKLQTCIAYIQGSTNRYRKENICKHEWVQALEQKRFIYLDGATWLATLADQLSNCNHFSSAHAVVLSIRSCVDTLYQLDETVYNVITLLSECQTSRHTSQTLSL